MTDALGQKLLKINLHTHTTDSDGALTPEEAARLYREQGYDLIAITDHWHFHPSETLDGMRILSGAEYNFNGRDGAGNVYHIVALGCTHDPNPLREDDVQTAIDKINAAGGIAVLAHPAWSLNTPDHVAKLGGIAATEIYNAVSTVGESDRPYSGYFVDTAACRGMIWPLLAADDTHYYDGRDEAKAWIMLNALPEASDEEILKAIREGAFYATRGPAIKTEFDGEELRLKTSPVEKIMFCSNMVWQKGHGHHGHGLTGAGYAVKEGEAFIRAEITDEKGFMAWSNIFTK